MGRAGEDHSGKTDADGASTNVTGADGPDDLAIYAEGLTKRYDDVVAVEDLSLAIERGTVYGFLGPNGAGKTTTMRMLTTLTRPTQGRARVAGASVENRRAVTPHIGYLPEEPPVYDELTGREQLEYAAGLRDIPAGEADRRIDDLLERFDLAADADKRIDAYSKGMRQKTGVIQAVLHDPAVVFMDEPTSGLDPRAARTMRETIAELTARDMTVFLSTHILPVVDDLADRVGVLHDGRLVAEGPPEELKARAGAGDVDGSLEDAFLAVTREARAGAELDLDDPEERSDDRGERSADDREAAADGDDAHDGRGRRSRNR